MEISNIVSDYLTCLLRSPKGDPDGLMQDLHELGYDEEAVRLVVQLTPIAFGRKLLEGRGIRFSEYFIRLTAEGRLLERDRLKRHPIFKYAQAAAEQHPELLALVGSRSSEVESINRSLRSGSEPRNLRLAPTVLFSGTPTGPGMQRAEQLVRREQQRWNNEQQWWKFW